MLNLYKKSTHDMCERKGWNRAPVATVWLLLTEEIGELASAIRQYTNVYQKTNLIKDKGTGTSYPLSPSEVPPPDNFARGHADVQMEVSLGV